MLGVVCCRPGGRGRPVRDMMLGLPVWRLELDTDCFSARRRSLRGGRRLVKLGVRRVLLPEEFAHSTLLEQMGLVPVEPTGLYAALAGQLTLAALTGRGEQPNRAGVTLCSAGVDAPFARAARFLCPRVKRLTLCAGRGGERLAAQLYRDFGAAVELGEDGQGLRVQFDGANDPEVLDISRPQLYMPELLLSVPGLELPTDWPADRVLTALWQSGRIGTERIEVCGAGKKTLTDAKAGTIM